MADVDLYLDPVCPFSWVTARWLLDAAHIEGTAVTLRQMNLAVLNEGEDLDAKHQRMMDRSRRLGRLFAAVATQHGPDAFARLYESIGTRIHVRREQITTGAVQQALAENGLPESLSGALDDGALDEAVRQAHQTSQDVVGGSAGSPIIAVEGHAFFGPVLTRTPTKADGVRLLGAILTVANISEFAVLKRPHQGPPVIDEYPR